jgi:hypothetical protein
MHCESLKRRSRENLPLSTRILVRQGIIHGVRNVVVYANIGHSVFSDDGGHFYAGGGFKVVIGR